MENEAIWSSALGNDLIARGFSSEIAKSALATPAGASHMDAATRVAAIFTAS